MARSTTRIATNFTNEPVLSATEFDVVVAAAGGGQANATLLTNGCNEIATVATTADSVRLPNFIQSGPGNNSTGGMTIFVANQGANSCQVFGSGIDTINNVATGTGVALAAGKNAVFFCIRSANIAAAIAGEWYMVLSA